MINPEGEARVAELCSEAATIAAELYSALLAVTVPDRAGRGTTNFNHNQAFELTKTLLGDIERAAAAAL